MLQDRQTSDSLAGPENKGTRVNLLNWDGKGSPPGCSRRKGGRTRERPSPEARAAPEQLTVAWQSVSLLLDYPDEDAARPGRADPGPRHGTLPTAIGDSIRAFLDHLESTPLPELQADYVETFDTRRRCNLFLTYFAHGDTRKRGMALLRFKQTYLASGFELDDAELPDHLCVVLEFAATVDQARGRDLMLDHRAGLELLRLSLRDLGSPWAGLVDAVTATLPPLRGDERDAVRRLAAEGPPEEEVGLAPFAGPAVQPGAVAAPARDDPAADAVLPRSPPMNEFLFVVVPYLCLTTFVVGHCGATATTSSAGPPGPPSSTRTGCCASAARCSTSACSGSSAATSSACWCRSPGRTRSGSASTPTTWSPSPAASLAGLMTVVGMAILIYRRRTVGPVFSATTPMDKVMYAFLAAVIVLGMWNTVAGSILTSAVSTTTAKASRSGSARSSPSTPTRS